MLFIALPLLQSCAMPYGIGVHGSPKISVPSVLGLFRRYKAAVFINILGLYWMHGYLLHGHILSKMS